MDDKPFSDPPKNPDRDLVFYYSRAHRLERASPAVRELNRDSSKSNPSLFGTLTANRSYAMLFIVIVVCSGFMLLFSRVSSEQKSPSSGSRWSSLGGNTLKVSGERFQGTTYLRITKTVPHNTPVYTGAVDMAITPVDIPASGAEAAQSPPVISHRIFFSADTEEVFGLSLPFEAPLILMLMQTEKDERISIQVKPE
ncbi:MAG: hypothetical protein LBC51_10765 [Treponema sp.]|jgi:hypothetical protein|nr:hypothetical protein [Treponema sp.]